MRKTFPDALLYHTRPQVVGEEMADPDRINAESPLAIVCVPTPQCSDDSEFAGAGLSAVEDVVNWLQTPLILPKSTFRSAPQTS